MVSVTDRTERIRESRSKIRPPFALDESLCFYSPQDNLDALGHPRIRDWFRFIAETYEPALPAGERHVLLLMPCTKTKPYPLSREHIGINRMLLEAGFRPTGGGPPDALMAAADAELPASLLDLSPLRNAQGVVIHRAVISEPLALVPYEHVLSYMGKPSPASAYDDPGLFENRGNAVSPWRADFTGIRLSEFRWKWGDGERRAYIGMHNAMAEALAATVTRLARRYDQRIAWVAPGLTHRSFVSSRAERKANGVVSYRQVGSERLPLTGANDLLPDGIKIACLPTPAQCRAARAKLAARLGCELSRVGGIYSRGGGDATPLALPELLHFLRDALVQAPTPATKAGAPA